MIYDPTAPKVHIDPPAAYLAPRQMNSATFTINYGHAGFTNWWGETCLAFPEAAKAAFNAAAAVWVSLLTTPVPIMIQACWANLNPGVLGYSGANTAYNFTNRPLANTYYAMPVANALAGSDLDPSHEDMSIAYTHGFRNNFYFGTDGLTPHSLLLSILHSPLSTLHSLLYFLCYS